MFRPVFSVARCATRLLARAQHSNPSALVSEGTPSRQRLAALLQSLRDELPKSQLDHAAGGEDPTQVLSQCLADLDGLFTIVVVGEYNAGKTALINAVLRRPRFLKQGVTPTTERVTVVRYGPPPESVVQGTDMDTAFCSNDWLRDVHLVDTPGTNAVLRQHQQLTERFLPRCDLVLFVTSAERPFSDSERQFLELVRDWGRKVVVVLSKSDLLLDGAAADADTPDEAGQAGERALRTVVQFVEGHAHNLLGRTPRVIPYSSKRALAQPPNSPPPELEQFLHSLTSHERAVIKLRGASAAGLAVAHAHLNKLQQRQRAVQRHDAAAQRLRHRLDAWKDAALADIPARLAPVRLAFRDLRDAGAAWLDRTIQPSNILQLVWSVRDNHQALKTEYQLAVSGNEKQLTEALGNVLEWQAAQVQGMFRDVLDEAEAQQRQLGRSEETEADAQARQTVRQVPAALARIQADGALAASPVEVLREMRRAVEASLSQCPSNNAQRLQEDLAGAMQGLFAAQVGALGAGAIIAVGALSKATLTLPIVMSVASLTVLPYKRQQMVQYLDEQIKGAEQLAERELRKIVEQELDRGFSATQAALRPYLLWVETERRALAEGEAKASTLIRELQEVETTLH